MGVGVGGREVRGAGGVGGKGEGEGWGRRGREVGGVEGVGGKCKGWEKEGRKTSASSNVAGSFLRRNRPRSAFLTRVRFTILPVHPDLARPENL
ncbi:hypothetical protein Pmani_014124 [Petrolisthes manimaculis]|uniref:Uncharacterized protein n=1 Tax=Petrolisthes manimaculis TaxID=1843537 RepID=A0AAE1PU76_9EUCA|nr:hypothetical protein Pmani_014124 [Petrolisthes manimaculis]